VVILLLFYYYCNYEKYVLLIMIINVYFRIYQNSECKIYYESNICLFTSDKTGDRFNC